MTALKKNERVFYIGDDRLSTRVVTLVSRLNEDNTLSVGWSVNNPTRWVVTDGNRYSCAMTKVAGDQFCKKVGRTLALKRLNDAPITSGPLAEDADLQKVAISLVVDSDMACDRVRKVLRSYQEFCEWLDGIRAKAEEVAADDEMSSMQP